ncbi:related to G-patch domain [Lecanosticta acicola]|uniref:Related to G-patch domain n=1 Tax=Lecanosticta acicola TaxID=111012 RepID=A0AAI8Z1M0_9PEZI|nr:related to G-patch domain [Lecanosticta acicola]
MANGEEEEEDEEDYLTMSFEDPQPTKSSSIQRTARLKKEAAERGRVPSRKEREAAAAEAREKALATSLLETENAAQSKGAKMMAKMGYVSGSALGKAEDARTRPIEVQMKDDRGGIGMESEKKRKVREAAEAMRASEKKVKLSAEEYRERNMREREERRAESQWWSAMKLLQGFDEEQEEAEEAGTVEGGAKEKQNRHRHSARKPLRSISIFYRPLVKARLETERDRRMRSELSQSLSRRAYYDKPNNNEDDEDGASDDHLALPTPAVVEEEDLDQEDAELEEWEALPFADRLQRILSHLRERYHYCFWCKFRYPDAGLEGCPGLTEDEHG